jgi:hypothetical protein
VVIILIRGMAMASLFPLVRFQGAEYLIVNGGEDWRKYGGALSTPSQYQTFAESYAHLGADGNIWQHYRVVGGIDDLEYLGEADIDGKLIVEGEVADG